MNQDTERNMLFADALNEMGAAAGLDDGKVWLVDDAPEPEPFMIVSPRFQIKMQANGNREVHDSPGGIIVQGLDTTDNRAVSAIYNASGPSGELAWRAVEVEGETPVAPAEPEPEPEPEPESEPTKRYLGDGLYADFADGQLVLTAEDGIRATNTVYLNSQVLNALKGYVKNLGGRI